MGESTKPSTPTRQEASVDDASEPVQDVILEHARAFLDDETVKTATPQEKRVFLKRKGLDDAQITQLLNETREESQSPAAQPTAESLEASDDAHHEHDAQTDSKEEALPSADGSSPSVSPTVDTSPIPMMSSTTDSPPPIITYPEFLTKPQRPPPIITPSRLANIIAVSGSAWALIYGISGLVVRPMVDGLNDARSEYCDHVNGKLSLLVEKLEATASEVPYKHGKPLRSQSPGRAIDDNESTTSDPTELFHRDVGTQTSPSPSILGTTSNTGNNSEKPVDVQARRLSAISTSLRELTLMHTQVAESNADLRSAIGDVRDQMDKLAYPLVQDFTTYSSFSYGQGAEPDDEFKKTKDAIRSVKGLFLSSRSFPAVATR